jgi:hypothetical protein
MGKRIAARSCAAKAGFPRKGRKIGAKPAGTACFHEVAAFQNLNTGAPRNQQFRTAISAQTRRNLKTRNQARGVIEMSTTDQNKQGGKSGQRNRTRKKQEGRKPDQAQEHGHDAKTLIDAAIGSTDASEIAAVALEEPPPIGEALSADTIASAAALDPCPSDATVHVDATPPAAAVAADPSPIGLQTIATAYRDYTRKSLADAHCFVEKLSGVRSIDKALEVQTEFAKQAYETFVADSRKIRSLYGELFRQALPMGRRDR